MRCQTESGIAGVLSPLAPTWSRSSSSGVAGEAAVIAAFGSTTDAALLAAAMQVTR